VSVLKEGVGSVSVLSIDKSRRGTQVFCVARKLIVEYAGAIYHVMNRRDRRKVIFREGAERELFVETLGQACAKTGC
jgi:hypothetical protein